MVMRDKQKQGDLESHLHEDSLPFFRGFYNFFRNTFGATIKAVFCDAHPQRLFDISVGSKLIEGEEASIASKNIWLHRNTPIKRYRGRTGRYCHKSSRELVDQYYQNWGIMPSRQLSGLRTFGEILEAARSNVATTENARQKK